MNVFRKRIPQNLDEWLEIATKRLTDSSKQRIRAEIQSHYSDAVEEYIRTGATERDSHAAALLDLGDARRAGRRFRKEHLTAFEATQLASSQKTSLMALSLVWSFIVFVLVFLVELDGYQQGLHHLPIGLVVADALLMVVLPTFCFLMARFGAKAHLRWTALTQMLVSLRYPLFALLLTSSNTSRFAGIGVWINLLMLALNLFTGLRLWHKLRLTGDTLPPDAPPPTSASS